MYRFWLIRSSIVEALYRTGFPPEDDHMVALISLVMDYNI